VFKFAAVSIGYTCVWMALCSELNTFRKLYGPSVLLKMNVFYYLPSIPLLAISSSIDEPLDRYFGVAKTVLMRLVLGMGSCAVIGFVFPFEPNNLNYMLWTTGALGVAHGISFSASYQLVSKYANKNTIALGLGCVGSGALVLFLELSLRMGTSPSVEDEYILYFACAGMSIVGLISAVSLLLRHWRSIEAASLGLAATGTAKQEMEDELSHHLLAEAQPSPATAHPASYAVRLGSSDSLSDGGEAEGAGGIEPSGHSRSGHGRHSTSRHGPDRQGSGPGMPRRRGSVAALLALSPLDFFKSVSDGESTLLLDSSIYSGRRGGQAAHGDDVWRATVLAERGHGGRRARQGSTSTLGGASPPQPLSPLSGRSLQGGHRSPSPFAAGAPQQQQGGRTPATALQASSPGAGAAKMASSLPSHKETVSSAHHGSGGHPVTAAAIAAHHGGGGGGGGSGRGSGGAGGSHMSRASSAVSLSSVLSDAGEQVVHASENALNVMKRMWPCQVALFTSGSTTLMIFPLVTYVPSSGTLGDLLPKWLFFVRLFSDLAGRLLPRARAVAVRTPGAVLALAALMLALTPLFYLYVQLAPPWFRSDTLACVYIGTVFLLNGMVNTNVYLLAPREVLPAQKATAAGILAVTYQAAHVFGLLAGTALCLIVFTGF